VLAQIENLRQHALRPEISAEISAKTVVLLYIRLWIVVLIK
jgi:hypothetical protein